MDIDDMSLKDKEFLQQLEEQAKLEEIEENAEQSKMRLLMRARVKKVNTYFHIKRECVNMRISPRVYALRMGY